MRLSVDELYDYADQDEQVFYYSLLWGELTLAMSFILLDHAATGTGTEFRVTVGEASPCCSWPVWEKRGADSSPYLYGECGMCRQPCRVSNYPGGWEEPLLQYFSIEPLVLSSQAEPRLSLALEHLLRPLVQNELELPLAVNELAAELEAFARDVVSGLGWVDYVYEELALLESATS